MPNTNAFALDMPSCAECISIGIVVPELLADMEDAIGIEATRAFLSDFGGYRIRIAKSDLDPASMHYLAFRWLRNEVGSGDLVVPIGPAGQRARRAWAIYGQLRDGVSVNAAARVVGCHRRTVELHKSSLRRRGHLPAATASKDPVR